MPKKNKIGMVFQHFNLFETLSVFENLSIDATEDDKNLRLRINEIFKKYNFSIDLDVPVLNSNNLMKVLNKLLT